MFEIIQKQENFKTLELFYQVIFCLIRVDVHQISQEDKKKLCESFLSVFSKE